MKSDAVKIQESREREAVYKVVGDLVTNPAVLGVAGFILTEWLQSHDEYKAVSQPGTHALVTQKVRVPGGGFMGSVAGSFLEAGLVGYMVGPAIVESAKIASGVGAFKGLAGLLK